MNKYLVAIFDDYNQVSDAIFDLKRKLDNPAISLIGLNPNSSVVERRFEGQEEIEDSVQISVINSIENFNYIEVPELGTLILAGELGDILSSSPYTSGEKLGGLNSALNFDLGFSKNESIKYSDYVSNGQILLLVRSKYKDLVHKSLQEFKALDINIQELISPK